MLSTRSLRRARGRPVGPTRSDPNPPGEEAAVHGGVREATDDGSRGGAYRCARCGAVLAPRSARTEIAGAHEHTFMNPAGFVFTIRCLSSAPGCGGVGEESGEWSWFPGHLWRVAICRGCRMHVGWGFRPNGEVTGSFFGLIADRIVLDERGDRAG